MRSIVHRLYADERNKVKGKRADLYGERTAFNKMPSSLYFQGKKCYS